MSQGVFTVQSVAIRDCVSSDFEDILVLLKQLWPEKELHKTPLQKIFTEKMSSNHHWYFGAEIGKKVIGFCSLQVETSLWQEGYMAAIEELVVDEKVRGCGIGGGLLNTAFEVAKARGCKRIELDSGFHRKEAQNFYEKMGFINSALLFTKEL